MRIKNLEIKLKELEPSLTFYSVNYTISQYLGLKKLEKHHLYTPAEMYAWVRNNYKYISGNPTYTDIKPTVQSRLEQIINQDD